MKDLIERQKAIDALWEIRQEEISDGRRFHNHCSLSTAVDVIKDLPSAQPEPCEDAISRQTAIDTEGLEEEIRCEMCRNPMHTDRGCDGNCKYDEKLYEKIMQILDKRIMPLPYAQPEEVIPHRNYKYLSDYWCECGWHLGKKGEVKYCSECGRKVNWDG